jgi:adenylate cyclase class 2
LDEPIEQEVKLRTAGPDAARAAVARLGAALLRARHLEDNLLFDDPASSLASGGKLLRLRRTPAGAVLTYKGSRRVVEGVRRLVEVETAVADGDALEAILTGLGFRRVFRYQKQREVYRWQEVEIVVDETPIGTYLEIEGPLPAIHRAAAALGYGPADYVVDSYARLFRAAGGTGDMVFR